MERMEKALPIIFCLVTGEHDTGRSDVQSVSNDV